MRALAPTLLAVVALAASIQLISAVPAAAQSTADIPVGCKPAAALPCLEPSAPSAAPMIDVVDWARTTLMRHLGWGAQVPGYLVSRPAPVRPIFVAVPVTPRRPAR